MKCECNSVSFLLPRTHEVMMRRNLGTVIATALMSFMLQPAFAFESAPEVIAAKMAGVTDEIHRNEIGKPVQTEQTAIVRDLDALIASLEKQCENCKGNMKRNNPNRGMRDSTISSGSGGIGTLVNPADSGKDWAKLSGRERDRILQSMTEGFPPEYRMVLERYYRRLAEEKRAPATGATTESNDKDAVSPK
jgi:hypothetical protein